MQKMRNPPWWLPPLAPGSTNKIPSPSEIAASIAATGQRAMADNRPLAVTGKPRRGPRPPHPNPPWWAPGGSGIDPNKTAPDSNAPVIGNAPNGRPVTGAYSRQPGSQATAAPDMSAYSPGRAQPQQTSQGTPYSPPAAQQPAQPSYAMPQFDYEGMMRQAQEQMRQYYQSFMPQVASAAPITQPVPPPPPGPPTGPIMGVQPAPQPFTFTIPPAVTSPADLPPEQRPPGFTQTFTDPFGNQTKNNPMAQRDALIQRINEESLPYYMGRPGQFNPNLQELWGQAGNMVSNGWANPLAGLFG